MRAAAAPLDLRDAFERHPFACFVLAFGFVAAIVGWPYLFGDKAFAFVDIGTDTFFQFYPLQVQASEALRDGSLFSYSLRVGLGAYPGVTHDIGVLLPALFPPDWQLDLRIYRYLLILFVAGGGFFFYLRTLGLRGNLCSLGAFAYTFCGYALVNAQWDPHGIEYAAYPFMLAALELALQRSRPSYAIAIGLIAANEHIFSIFSNVVLIIVYAAIRFYVAGYRHGPSKYLWLLVRIGLCYVVGIALLAPLVLPKLWYLLDSPRVSGRASHLQMLLDAVFSVNDGRLIVEQLLGFVHKDIFGNAADYKGYGNYFEAPDFYVGIWSLIALPQLLVPRRSRWQRRLLIATLVLVATYVAFPAVRYSVFLFGHNAFRTSTLWLSSLVLVAALFALRGTTKVGTSPRLALATAALCVLCIGIAAIRYAASIDTAHVIKAVAFLAGYALMFAALAGRGRGLVAAIAAVAVCEALLFAYPAILSRHAATRDGVAIGRRYDDAAAQTIAAIRAEQPPHAFYRIAKDFHSVDHCDALIQNYRGFKSYYFNGSAYTRFVDAFRLPRPIQVVSVASEPVERLDILRLLGFRYLLTRDPARWNATPGAVFESQNGDVFRYRLDAAPAYLFDELRSIADDEHRAPEGIALDRTLIVRERDADALGRHLGTSPDESWRRRSVELSAPRDDLLSARIDSDRAAVLLLPVPFDRGWHVAVDGIATTPVEVDFGLIGVAVSAGAHHVTASFVAPGLELGYWIATLASVIAFFVFLQRPRRERPSRAIFAM